VKIDELLVVKFKSPQHKAVVNLRVTSNYLHNVQNSFVQDYDLSLPQFNILRILRGANQSLNVNTVKDRMLEKSPNTTRLMDKLIEKGLIERTRCENDRRVVYVQIAQKGLDLLSEIDDHMEGSSLMPRGLNDDEANQLSDLLDKLRSQY
jgi:MarR family 2-MHQ and catechol resistance regulon transcriptional repressor